MIAHLWFEVFFGVSLAESVELDFTKQVYQQIESEISTRLSISTDDVTVHHLSMTNSHRCSKATYVKTEISDSEDFRGKTLVGVEGWQEEKLCGRWTVQADIEIWSDLPVAQFAADPGEVVAIDFQRGRLDQVREPIFVYTSTLQNATMVAVVPIAQGEVLKRTNLRRKLDFEQGQAVKVLVQKGALTVQVNGVLLRGGYIGDIVKVRSSTNSILEGQLTENGTVLLK